MARARFKDLCLDAGSPARLGAFWAAVLGRTWEAQDNGEGLLRGPTPQHTIWVNRVPEARTVKHRVHLDIYARDLAGLESLGHHRGAAAWHAHLDGHDRSRGRRVLRVPASRGPG